MALPIVTVEKAYLYIQYWNRTKATYFEIITEFFPLCLVLNENHHVLVPILNQTAKPPWPCPKQPCIGAYISVQSM